MWESLAQTPTRTSTGHLECYFLSSSPSKNIQPLHLFYLNTAQQTLNFFSHGFYCIFFPKAFKFFCCVCEPGLICHAIFKNIKQTLPGWQGEKNCSFMHLKLMASGGFIREVKGSLCVFPLKHRIFSFKLNCEQNLNAWKVKAEVPGWKGGWGTVQSQTGTGTCPAPHSSKCFQ